MRKLLYFCYGLYLFLAVLGSSPSIAAGDVNKPYSIFIVPQLAPVASYKAWTPVLKKLSEATGLAFDLRVESSIPDFERVLATGEPDFAFMNPYHMIVAKRDKRYTPLLRDSKKMLEGMLVVRKDGEIKSLADLNGKTLSFPAPNAFAASLLIRALLAKQNINITPSYVKTHSNVYRSVLLQDVSAGGGVNNTFQREPDDVRDQLQILYVTPPTAPHPLAASSTISEAVRAKVISAFIKLATDPANAELFDAIQMPMPVPADYVRDYQSLEALGLDKFAVTGSD
ncbi:MAG: hypothetical protein RI893_661 [Pseudomonadota bacterium]|jgi:phosphonate transport system substrate-binding protein